MRKIKVCAGIGDNAWLLAKLINSGERFDFELPDGNPRRGKQLFDMLPQVANSATYIPGLTYRKLAQNNIQFDYRYFHQVKQQEFYLSCNDWLEKGKRLEGFFSDLPLSFKLPWQTSEEDKQAVAKDFPAKQKYIGIYGSAYSTARAWKEYGAWGVQQWLELIKLIYAERPKATFCIIGAEWDNDFAMDLIAALKAARIPHMNTIGKPLGYFVELAKVLSYSFYFPSGLPILSESIIGGGDCTMFYGTNLTKMMGSWCDPTRRESGAFKECLFCEPGQIHEWVKNVYKLYDKI